MNHKVYTHPGIHAYGTFEEAAASAMHRATPGWIMERPEGAGSAYSTGWHYIIAEREHYESHGYITRAVVNIVIDVTEPSKVTAETQLTEAYAHVAEKPTVEPVGPVTVATFIEYLKTQPPGMLVAYSFQSDWSLLELSDISVLQACAPRPDGVIQGKRPDMPSVPYLLLPGN